MVNIWQHIGLLISPCMSMVVVLRWLEQGKNPLVSIYCIHILFINYKEKSFVGRLVCRCSVQPFVSSLHDDVVFAFGQKYLSLVTVVCLVLLLSEFLSLHGPFSKYLLLATAHVRTFDLELGLDVPMARARRRRRCSFSPYGYFHTPCRVTPPTPAPGVCALTAA